MKRIALLAVIGLMFAAFLVPGRAYALDCTPGPNKDLSGCVYNGQSLPFSNFSNSNLTAATMNGADLHGSNFSGANLTATTMNGANLAGANFNGATLNATTMDGANLLGATFVGATFNAVTWGASTICPDGTLSGANGNSCLNNLIPAPQPEPKRLVICHIPPGNPANAHTIRIGESAWAAHKAHGDYLGECFPPRPKHEGHGGEHEGHGGEHEGHGGEVED